MAKECTSENATLLERCSSCIFRTFNLLKITFQIARLLPVRDPDWPYLISDIMFIGWPERDIDN
jgi:hypothetical protein